MSLIDFNSLISNFLWILAIAWLLTVISMARWVAHQRGRKLWEQLNQTTQQLQLLIGGLFLCLGIGLSVGQLWLMIVWFVLGFLFLILIIFTARGITKRIIK